MSDEIVILRSDPGITIWAGLTSTGHLCVRGQDLAAGDVFGDGVDEYEWAHTIPSDSFGRVLAALGEPPDVPILDAVRRHRDELMVRGFAKWLATTGIEYHFWSRMG